MRGKAGVAEQAVGRRRQASEPAGSRERAANEHGFADPKNWRALTKLRLNANYATTLLRTLLPTNAEMSRWLDAADDHPAPDSHQPY
ncbi:MULTISPECIES: hypothetical protein [unclassified Streptomyces]|uniref:hypothetical protein n=1 Tax=unclassified Streptomyces TaxID=2593676 RepID=UPI003244BB29